jgi:hypothetical protein
MPRERLGGFVMTRSTVLVLAALAIFAPRPAFGLIRGDKGNKPVPDPGWPKGAAQIFNFTGRAAWWEGPPFGGGEWHAECRGDAKALNGILADFAKLDVKTKRILVHDGEGYSFWLAPNQEKEKLADARIDWVFMVWQPSNWAQLHQLPADLNPTKPADASPPSQIDIYTARIRWADVVVPNGIEVVDQRLEAHGFTIADGIVLEGRVTDAATKAPIAAAMRLERIEPQKQGGYLYSIIGAAKADAQGHWVLKNAQAGWVRIVADSESYVPRVIGYDKFDDQPRWQAYDAELARPGPVSGRVTDADGNPLSDVTVRFDNVQPKTGGRYESPDGFEFKTDAQGRFQAQAVPEGTATVWIHKTGYTRPGLGAAISMPKDDVELQMIRASDVRVTVDFTGKPRPKGYIVQITPEGGDAVGKYGGSGNINAQNEIVFRSVPPGRYTLQGQPNPSSADEHTEPVTVDLKGGETIEVTLKAK